MIDRVKIAVLRSDWVIRMYLFGQAGPTNEQVITGYNTDVEHDGVVYHVQTEDKGLQTPLILSLVYTGGAILASKRAPYDDLIASGLKRTLAERLERQHKLICAAVHAGRIEELKRMGDRDTANLPPAPKPTEPEPVEAAPAGGGDATTPLPPVEDRIAISSDTEEGLTIKLMDEKELRAGESVTLRIEVTRPTKNGRKPAAKASITVKLLGSNFQPSSTYSTTDSAGRSSVSISLPMFSTGRAAILMRAELDGDVAELRRIIQPSRS